MIESDDVDLHWVAKRFGFKKRSVLRMAQRGQVPGARKIQNRWRVDRATILKAWGFQESGSS